MDRDYWLKQGDKPLFPDMLWDRPENRMLAGKLAVIGGSAHGFAAAAEAYNEAAKAGVGTARVLLPDALTRAIGKAFPEAEFAPSTPSGSFATAALDTALDLAHWADGTLLAGDFGRNSETAVLLETFAAKYSAQLTITKDAADYFLANPAPVLDREHTTLVLSMAQLQKIALQAGFLTPITFGMDLLHLVEALHDFSAAHAGFIVTRHHDSIIVAARGRVSTTKVPTEPKIWRVRSAAHASVWWLQNPSKPFEALTTSLV